ncbi:hypothetical protein AGMMS49938_07910 [Fibrobacterales bacterium]|nr:hypothetical protein AGMMS49938_07910 [Fibrobacterales bacterium]
MEFLEISYMNLEPYLTIKIPDHSVSVYAMPQGKNAQYWARATLADLLNLPIAPIETDSLGKPKLPKNLGFANWSNSGTGCVLAYSKTCEVGIDLEFYRNRNFSALSKRFFALNEHTSKAEDFYRFWTCKEAFYKCCGGDFFTVLKTDLSEFHYLRNFQAPYRENHELALCVVEPQ